MGQGSKHEARLDLMIRTTVFCGAGVSLPFASTVGLGASFCVP